MAESLHPRVGRWSSDGTRGEGMAWRAPYNSDISEGDVRRGHGRVSRADAGGLLGPYGSDSSEEEARRGHGRAGCPHYVLNIVVYIDRYIYTH
jgi:hypothetical protein